MLKKDKKTLDNIKLLRYNKQAFTERREREMYLEN